MGTSDPGSAVDFREILKAKAKLETNTSMFLIFKGPKELAKQCFWLWFCFDNYSVLPQTH